MFPLGRRVILSIQNRGNMKVLQSILWLCLPGALLSQSLNTPTELKSLVRNSSIEYAYTAQKVNHVKAETVSITKTLFQREAEGEVLLSSYEEIESKNLKNLRTKAITALQKKDYGKARKYLKSGLESMPDNSSFMTLIGQSYRQQGQNDEALSWYDKATLNNRIDYEAYLETAQILMEKQEYETALKAALFAKALNRNDIEVHKTLVKIALFNGMSYNEWAFEPKVEIKNTSDKVQIIYEGDPWKAYGMSEAVWDHEPDYAATKKTKKSHKLDMIRYKESLLNGVIAYELMKYSDPKINYPELEAFSMAIGEGLTDEYINYEIIALKNPKLISAMSEEELDKTIQYILLAHFDKLPEKYALKDVDTNPQTIINKEIISE